MLEQKNPYWTDVGKEINAESHGVRYNIIKCII